MFFSHFVLAKKGPLARIWLAAHWDKKLTKAHILEINIERSVEGILQPKIKLALRTSGHLLLGVVRIYSRKAKYLLAECNEAFVKIKMAFRPGMVDLPEGNREAALATITLPEVFHDFENISDITIEVNAPTTLHQSRAEDITLKEDYGTLSLMGDDGFDMGFDDPEMARDATNIDEGFDQTGLLLPEEDDQARPSDRNSEDGPDKADKSDILIPNGDLTLKDIEDNDRGAASAGLFESGLFEDAPVAAVPPLETSEAGSANEQPFPVEEKGDVEMSDDDDDTYGGPPSVGLPSSPDSVTDQPVEGMGSSTNDGGDALPEGTDDAIQLPIADEAFNQNEGESFALGPLETVVHKGPERAKSKRKRKLIIDEVKNISGEEMKAQLSDTRDIISTLDLAPPTKRLMHWKESGGVEKLFALPGRCLQSKILSRLYLRHLTTRPMNNEPFETDDYYPTLEDMRTKESTRENLRSSKRQRCNGPESAAELDATEPLLIAAESKVVEDTAASTTTQQSVGEMNESFLNINEATIITNSEESQVPQETTEMAHLAVDNVQESNAVNTEKNDSAEIITEKENVSAENLFDQLSSTNQESTCGQTETEKQQTLLAMDDDDDYHNPDSVGPPEEQLYDETYEQFEERIHGKRATHLLQIMKRNLDVGNKIPFSAMTKGNLRKQVAQKFYTLLVLKKQQAIELEQSSAYEEIYISKGPQLEAVLQ